MNYAAIRPGLKALACDLLNLSDEKTVEWKAAIKAGGWRRGPRLTMSLKAVRGIGSDEWRRVGENVKQSGMRQATWTLKFESESKEDGDLAAADADRMRMGLRFPSSGEQLRALGLSIATIEPTQTMEFNTGAESRSVAVIDIQLNAVDNQTDQHEGASDWIDSTEVDSQSLIAEDGEPASVQINEKIDGTQPL